MKKHVVFSSILLFSFAILSIFPFVWMLISATNRSVDITKGRMWFGSALFENIEKLFASVDVWTAFGNSLAIALVGTVLALLISSCAGYGFEIFQSKGKSVLFSFLLLSMMIPFAAIMIPLYKLFAGAGMLDTLTAVILPSISTAFLIFFFRQNAKSFPRDILQAARVDGLGEWGIFFQIYFPTMRSTYAAAAIITFMNQWNAYLWPLIVLQTPEKRTVPLMLSNLASSYTPDYGVQMVAIILATLPTALLFFFMQKSFVEGMLGAVK